MNQELKEVQAGFRKGRGTRDQISNIDWVIEKATEFQKRSGHRKSNRIPEKHLLLLH